MNFCTRNLATNICQNFRTKTTIPKFLFSMDSSAGPVQTQITQKIEENLKPSVLQVVNESYKHSVPKGSESHFKVLVVSETFEGKTHIQRHRLVNSILKEELANQIHALSIQAKTPDQWSKSPQVIAETPPCLGGSKHDNKHAK